MSDEMIDNLREWLTMAEAERDEARTRVRLWKRAAKRHRAKSEERKRALQAALAAMLMADFYPNFSIPAGLGEQINRALED